jgi:molecular chaperone HscB
MKFYEALGLEPKLALDPDDLKQRFYDRSRQWHPDRFSRATSEEKQRSEEMTALLNDAFRALRDPVKRAEYFCRERGLEPSKNPPQDLLEEVFELNMAIEEARLDNGAGREAAMGQVREMLSHTDRSLEELFARHDAAPGRALLGVIRATLDRRQYIANLARDLDK